MTDVMLYSVIHVTSDVNDGSIKDYWLATLLLAYFHSIYPVTLICDKAADYLMSYTKSNNDECNHGVHAHGTILTYHNKFVLL